MLRGRDFYHGRLAEESLSRQSASGICAEELVDQLTELMRALVGVVGGDVDELIGVPDDPELRRVDVLGGVMAAHDRTGVVDHVRLDAECFHYLPGDRRALDFLVLAG